MERAVSGKVHHLGFGQAKVDMASDHRAAALPQMGAQNRDEQRG